MWRTTTILVASVLALTAIGLVMLASTSSVHGLARFDDPHYFVRRQAVALLIGVVAALVASRVSAAAWKQMALPAAIAAFVLLVLVLVPGIGISVKGSRRWLSLGFTTIQPSELAKISLVMLLAWWMSRVRRRAGEWVPGLAIPCFLMGALILPVLAEPDFGTSILMGLVGFAVLWAGGTRFRHLLLAGAAAAGALTVLIMQNEVRYRRIIAFRDPEAYAEREAFQLLNAIYAFVMGGGGGVGLGNSLQKRYYLPEAHNDFIFAIIGEELGLAASLGVVALFAVFFFTGLRIAARAPDLFSRLFALGLTCMIAFQAAINIGVVTGSLPTKGIPLPFISYGGTSLVVSLTMVGMLVSVARHAGDADPTLTAVKDRVRRL
ncbi:MAG: putative lipid II flippase FtsW [Kiritimatiellae bacterium]|nr:putative lipid II flippase FtsW [Kiritimatiellia bacterium]MDW8457564.1 putative lipid II flippase FtsW [Verrucomicrobiota bacterium]